MNIRPSIALAALILATVLEAHGNIITNADFESGFYNPFWANRNTAATCAVSISENHTPGGNKALRIAGRSGTGANSAGVSASLANVISAQDNGRTFTTRAWVKLDAYASVRLMLLHTVDGVAQPPLVMASRVVLTPGVWVQITGTQTLAWNGALTQTVLIFEIEQLQRSDTSVPVATVRFPDYWLDDISIDLDDDGDGLLNSEESPDHTQTTVSFSDDADSDDDGIPDDFERSHAPTLNARNAADAAQDSDNDEWTNIEEYIAASDPTDASSYPALSDPLATLAARALHRYFIHLAATGRHLCGQMVSDVATDYGPYVDGLANMPGGKYPAIMGLGPEGFAAPMDFVTDAMTAATYVAAGGIITLNWQIYNPWVKADASFGNSNFLGTGVDDFRVDITGLLDVNGIGATTNSPASNLAARAALLDWCDQTAALLQQHLPGVPILMRPLHEMNGSWYWWGHRTREEYIGLWNLVRDRFVNFHGMHNLLWVCSAAGDSHVPASASGTGTSIDYYYPGDNVVDVVGAHFYDDFASPFDPDRVWARYPKVFAIPEYGAGRTTRLTSAFDNRLAINTVRTRMPRAVYFNAWASWTNHDDDDSNPATPATNDDGNPASPDTMTHKYIAIADNPHADKLLADPAVVTRDEVNFMPPSSISASAASSNIFAATWPNIAGNSGYSVEISVTNARGSWTTASNVTANTISTTLGGFGPSTARYFRVRALYGSDDSLPTDAISATTWSLFQQWKNDTLGNFNAADISDDDHDGLANLLEYGLGTNPLTPSHSQQPSQSITAANGANYLSLTFRRRSGTSDVSYLVEASSDLAIGSWLPQPVQHGFPLDNGDGTETVTFRDIIPMDSAPSRFLRLKVSSP